MVQPELLEKYQPTIGIETHVQLKTQTKLFSGAGNDARGALPNTLISHIDVAMPGALPVLNEKAVELAVRAAFVLNTKPQRFSYFERKHYFYPDSPAGYQISQLAKPIIIGGKVDIKIGNAQKTISINRVQLEADAGKTTHPEGADYSLVDLNRAGTPLLEIVSEPEIHSPAEAKAYARELYLLMKYAGISDVDLYQGNMRFDVNVSVSDDPKKLGVRTEVKNLNSFKAVEAAAEFEIHRQIDLLEKGQAIAQETRGWDEAKQKTTAQRGKEEAQDYRYMPEPDIPPLELSEEYIEGLKKEVPIMPAEWRIKLSSLGLRDAETETLLEAEVENEEINLLAFIEQALAVNDKTAKQVANLMINVVIPFMREKGPSVVPQHGKWTLIILPIIELINMQKLNSNTAKQLLKELLEMKEMPNNIEQYAEGRKLIQVSNTDELESTIEQILEENPKAAKDVSEGEMKAIGFLVGQVMKATNGRANPALVDKIIKQKTGFNDGH